jgi:hypothetical protein
MAKASRGKRKRRGAAPKKKTGVMVGMRGGFQRVAKSVTGGNAKSSTLSNILWTVVLLAALGLFLYRRMR